MTDLKQNLKLMLDATTQKVERDKVELHNLYCYLSIKDLILGKFQPRQYFDENSINALASSIKKEGVLQPLIVRSAENQKYEVIAGERRWKAAIIAGLKEIPAIIRETNDETALVFGILENLQREDLNPIEEAMAFKKLIDEFSLTHDDVSTKVCKSRTYITNSLRLLNLPKHIQEALAKNHLQAGHAKAIVSLDNGAQEEVFKEIIDKKLSVRQTENLSRKHLFPSSKNETRYLDKNIDIISLEKEFSVKLNLPCKILLNKKSSGKLEIFFNDIEKLKRLLLND